MARRASKHPTDAELEILQILWEQGPAPLGTIHQNLSRRRAVAKTTVATTLSVMLDKKLVERVEEDHGSLWSAKISRTDSASGMLGKIIDRVFNGSAQRMVAHLVQGGRLSDEECEEIQQLLKLRRRNRKTS